MGAMTEFIDELEAETKAQRTRAEAAEANLAQARQRLATCERQRDHHKARAEGLAAQMAQVRAVATEILSDDCVRDAPWLERLSAALRVEGPEW